MIAFRQSNVLALPAGGQWSIRRCTAAQHSFLLLTNPEHPAKILALSGSGELFLRDLKPLEMEGLQS